MNVLIKSYIEPYLLGLEWNKDKSIGGSGGLLELMKEAWVKHLLGIQVVGVRDLWATLMDSNG